MACKYCNLKCRDWTEENTNLSEKETSKIANCNGFIENDENNYLNSIHDYRNGFKG